MNNFLEMFPVYFIVGIMSLLWVYAMYTVYWKWPREDKKPKTYEPYEGMDY